MARRAPTGRNAWSGAVRGASIEIASDEKRASPASLRPFESYRMAARTCTGARTSRNFVSFPSMAARSSVKKMIYGSVGTAARAPKKCQPNAPEKSRRALQNLGRTSLSSAITLDCA